MKLSNAWANTLRLPIIVGILAISAVAIAFQQPSPNLTFYKDPTQSIENRVNDLLVKMTFDEKLAQIQCIWQRKSAFIDKNGDLLADSAAVYLKHGIGQVGRPSEGFDRSKNTGRTAAQNAHFTNQIQKFLVEKTRLGIPAKFHEECLHGHAAKDATRGYPNSSAFGG